MKKILTLLLVFIAVLSVNQFVVHAQEGSTNDQANHNEGIDTTSNGDFQGPPIPSATPRTNTGTTNTGSTNRPTDTTINGRPTDTTIHAPTTITTLGNPLKNINSVPELLYKVVDLLIFIGVIIAVFMFIFVGFKFVWAQGNETELSEAKKWFMYVVIGTAILISAKVIVKVIQETLTSAGVVDERIWNKP